MRGPGRISRSDLTVAARPGWTHSFALRISVVLVAGPMPSPPPGRACSVYRLLKAHDLITSPAYIVIKANDEFKDKTTRPNEMWQTDITYRAPRPGWGRSGVHMTGMH